MTSQLERLAKPFPDRLVHSNPSGGGSYVKQSVVTEKLLAVVGPFDFELVEVIRGSVAEIVAKADAKSARGRSGAPALAGAVVGVVCRLSVDVDGRRVRVEEVGDCEDPHNWPHDGARLKDAMSDALKRAAMRIGVALHLWSGAEFSLYEQLHENAEGDRREKPEHASATAERSPSPSAIRDAEGGRGAPDSMQRGRGSTSAPSATDAEGRGAPAAASPAISAGLPVVSETPSAATQPGSPAIPKAQREKLKRRCAELQASGVSVADERESRGLPLVDSCNEIQFDAFVTMIDDLYRELEKPFSEATS